MVKLYTFLLLSLATPVLAAPGEVEKVVGTQVFEVRLGSGLAPLISEGFTPRADSIRRHLVLESGWLLPGVRFTPDSALAPNEYKILANGTPLGQAKVEADQVMVIGPESKLANFAGPLTQDPTYGMPGKWIAPSDKAKAEQMGCMVFDAVSIWSSQMTELCRSHAAELYTPDHLTAGLATLQSVQPVLSERLSNGPILREKLLSMIRNLLAEQVPVRDLERLAELLVRSPDLSADALSEAARVQLAGSILKDLVAEGTVSITQVGPKLDAALAKLGSYSAQGLLIADNPAVYAEILKAVKEAVASMQGLGVQPLLVTSPASRLVLRRLTQKDHPNLMILSREELLPKFGYKTVGTVELP